MSAEDDAHGLDCVCPWCVGERRTYCALTGGAEDHQDHRLPSCPANVTPPGEPR